MSLGEQQLKYSRLNDWTPDSGVDFVKFLHAGLFAADCFLDDERIQRDGVTLVIDCEGMRLSWLFQLLPPSQIPVCSSDIYTYRGRERERKRQFIFYLLRVRWHTPKKDVPFASQPSIS